jgi:hypothetical protein
MRGRSFRPDEETKAQIVRGLLQLRKDGHFHAIYVSGDVLRIQFEEYGLKELIGWRKAHEMVMAASQALAESLNAERQPPRKPATSEGWERARGARR